MTITVGAKEARSRFSDLLGSVRYRDETVIVERAGKPFAVMISPEQYERYRQFLREEVGRALADIHEHNEDVDPEQADRDVAKAIAEVRAERDAGRK